MKRLIVAAASAVLLLAAPAAAQQYPPAVNSLTVTDSTPTPGQTIGMEARTFAAGGQVTFTLASAGTVLATGTADASGIVSAQGTIPADTPLGEHTLTAVGPAPDGSELSLSVTLTVVAAGDDEADESASGSLPTTGSDSSIPLAKLGIGLAAVGGVVTAVAAKRRKAAA
ncbi:MAG: LPXTG cell wall anchor domain-containing protein, partial [Acidimicrobiales bacterium]|nr:LPXTG cell wall anchor domain-containing protein [Acidimicrobiales bacterium]